MSMKRLLLYRKNVLVHDQDGTQNLKLNVMLGIIEQRTSYVI